MLTFVNIDQADLTGPTCISIGNFDGLHRGHQALLQQMVNMAKAETAQRQQTGRLDRGPMQTGLVTFDPHPLAVLRPTETHWLLTTPRERLDLAAKQGIDFGIIQQFTPEIAALSPTDFIRLLKTKLRLAILVVGPDFALGRGRTGTVDVLRALGQDLDFAVHVIEPIDWNGMSVRSSRIRAALRDGDVALTATMLGRPYQATGTVIQGDQRGRQIGIPTANIQTPANKLLPRNGVYATRVGLTVNGTTHWFDSVANLGVRPTVNGVEQRLEVHLLDFPPKAAMSQQSSSLADDSDSLIHRALATGDLYGQELMVDFIARLRDEQRFSGLDALVAQIHADIAQARALFTS